LILFSVQYQLFHLFKDLKVELIRKQTVILYVASNIFVSLSNAYAIIYQEYISAQGRVSLNVFMRHLQLRRRLQQAACSGKLNTQSRVGMAPESAHIVS